MVGGILGHLIMGVSLIYRDVDFEGERKTNNRLLGDIYISRESGVSFAA